MSVAFQHQDKRLEPIVDINKKEEELIQRLIAQDRSAQRELYKTYFGKLAGVPMRYTSNKEDAYEILNDAFMKIFSSIQNYKGSGSLSGWMYKIVLYTTFAQLRKKYKYKEAMEEMEPQLLTVENDALSNLGLEEIYEKLQLLPNSHRTVFSMFVIDGLKHQEIADQLGITRGTSKWYLAKARIQLQELLNKH